MSSLPGTDPEPDVRSPTAEPTSSLDEAAADVLAEGSPVKVEVTVAGHTVIIEAHRPMEAVADLALHLIGCTAGYARRMPYGFDTGHADTQLAGTDDPSTVTAGCPSEPGAAG